MHPFGQTVWKNNVKKRIFVRGHYEVRWYPQRVALWAGTPAVWHHLDNSARSPRFPHEKDLQRRYCSLWAAGHLQPRHTRTRKTPLKLLVEFFYEYAHFIPVISTNNFLWSKRVLHAKLDNSVVSEIWDFFSRLCDVDVQSDCSYVYRIETCKKYSDLIFGIVVFWTDPHLVSGVHRHQQVPLEWWSWWWCPDPFGLHSLLHWSESLEHTHTQNCHISTVWFSHYAKFPHAQMLPQKFLKAYLFCSWKIKCLDKDDSGSMIAGGHQLW